MDLGLKGRVAIIGGGSKGLGRACADSLAQEGANLVICSRNAQELDQAAGEIGKASGVEVLAVPGDLSQLPDIQHLVKRTVDHFGRLDVLVNNSGGPPAGRAADTTEADPRGSAHRRSPHGSPRARLLRQEEDYR